MKSMESIESNKQDQLFQQQGKHQQAADHWLQLITQITLDYKRPNVAELCVENAKQQEDVLILEKV